LVAVVPLFLLHYDRTKSTKRMSPTEVLAAMREGIVFVKQRQVLLGAMTLDMFAVIFGGAAALLPVYAHDILHAGASGYGILSSSLQVGAFVMAFGLVWRPPVKRTGRALVVTICIYAIFTILFGISRNFALSVVLYGLL